LEPGEAAAPAADPLLDLTLRELQLALHEEMQRLPAKYRTPLILCYLEGKTQGEAARQLGWSKGAIRGQLNRGREHLRQRLAERGLALSAATVVTALTARTAAAVAPALANGIARTAAAFCAGQGGAGHGSTRVADLVEGATKAMCFTKAKIATLFVLLVGLMTWGLGTRTYQVQAQRASALAAAPLPAPQGQPAAPAPGERDGKKLEIAGRI